MSARLLITNARQIVQITESADIRFLKGIDADRIKILEDNDARLALLISDGIIADLGLFKEVKERNDLSDVEIIDAQKGVILPGLVDAHSHPVFAGDRVHEFAMKLAGATYLEVQAAGGGIHFTTSATRAATENDLYQDFKKIANQMLASGTTTLEAKSGYGLETSTEMKMLKVLERVNREGPLEISGTFCGAHAVPRGTDEHTQTHLIAGEMLDLIRKCKENGELKCVENIDVFCEKGNFNVENTERILLAGAKMGLKGNFHAEELSCLHSAEMGARLQVQAMSHLEEISDDGIKQMAQSGSVAVLLPSTAFLLRLTPPPARKMINEGVIVALGSDFNPNAWCPAMAAIMHMACVTMRLSLAEALSAATINSAHSIGRGATHGSLHKGRVGDLLILKVPKWEHLIYRFAAHNTIISHVVKRGNIVYKNENV
ncbi:unnamed protein product, partial [Mesorhabditis belari]|uniref:Probable imidazolonepropionase n=1 Tax=Mesorhabditis belari TaxID=2138241 RepID=A0AAF3E9W0_9BILA